MYFKVFVVIYVLSFERRLLKFKTYLLNIFILRAVESAQVCVSVKPWKKSSID